MCLCACVQSMNHSSNEVKQLMARASTAVGRAEVLRAEAGGAGADVLRALLPALVNGTKEKNTYVRANSEIALRAVLRLPHDDTFHQVPLTLLLHCSLHYERHGRLVNFLSL